MKKREAKRRRRKKQKCEKKLPEKKLILLIKQNDATREAKKYLTQEMISNHLLCQIFFAYVIIDYISKHNTEKVCSNFYATHKARCMRTKTKNFITEGTS